MTRPRITDLDVIARFVEKIEFGDGPEDCWMWKPANEEVYGAFRIENTSRPAHRISYRIYRGQLEEGFHVHHRCETKGCVNPNHLELMTASQHHSMHASGVRKAWGSEQEHGLSAGTVRDIRQRYDDGKTQKEIADDLNIGQSSVSRIVRGESYPNID